MTEIESKSDSRTTSSQINRKIVDVPDLAGPQNTTLQKLLTEEETLKKELHNLEHAVSSDEAAEKIQAYISKTKEPLSHFDEGPWSQCFTNDTLILLENNQYKRIDEINTNDRVLSFDLKNDKYLNSNFRQDGHAANHTQYKQILSTVTRVHKSLTNKIIQLTFQHESEKNIVLKCTQDHPIWTITKGWCNISGKHVSNNHIDRISFLQVGDKCLLFDGDTVTLSDIQIIYHNDNPIYVYNLTVDNTQTFFANDILVHNKFCRDGCCVIL